MKKFGLFLIAAMAVIAFTSCNDDSDGDYPRYSLITTVCTSDGGDYYFLRDNGEKLYPGDKTRLPGYKPDPEKTQRTIVWFNLLTDAPAGYDYNIALYGVDNIFTGTSKIVDTQEQLDELGSEQTGYREDTFNLTKEWLTFYALYPVSDNSKHNFTVIVNNVEDDSEPESAQEAGSDYLKLELRHSAGGDTQGYTHGFYLSFDLTPLAEQLEGKKGVILHIETRENGPRNVKLDLPQEK